ncbi:Asr1405/Asl0597 family protein [Calothrix sp. NIES-3974]|uniref:Asr1405/Asl0597 family protein n=1 Tax=Calothrix sp. NIES-3974 TaxID=2005462 RepID=UPI000B62176F|nr:Asr1405/Asl0597 family protein [Calothrix sp. NIES-3974]BAZ07868.1 hypothetical protein NIES3974_45330 [Calothrix sp. NIES-3974]
MLNSPNSHIFTTQILQFHCGDQPALRFTYRWPIFQRLQELSIPCSCLADGTLEVQVETPLTALQVRSVVMQYTASRHQLITWLEFCWQ